MWCRKLEIPSYAKPMKPVIRDVIITLFCLSCLVNVGSIKANSIVRISVKKVLLLYSATQLDQMVSVVLYNLTPGRGLTQPWCGHHFEVIRAGRQLTS